MIRLERVSARGSARRGLAPARLVDASLQAVSGVHVLLGAEADGTSLVAGLVTGRLTPRAGLVEVEGRSPARSAPYLAALGLEPSLPDELSGDECRALAADLRGPFSPGEDPFAALGVSSHRSTRLGRLPSDTRRAVELAIALASAARVLVLEEPFRGLAPPAARRLEAVLRARARAGTTALVTTASPREALALGDRVTLVDRGALVPVGDPLVLLSGREPARLVVTLGAPDDPDAVSRLVGELRASGAPTRLDLDGARLTVEGPDLAALAAALTRALGASGARVRGVEPVAARLGVLPATLASAVARAAAPPRSLAPTPRPPSVAP